MTWDSLAGISWMPSSSRNLTFGGWTGSRFLLLGFWLRMVIREPTLGFFPESTKEANPSQWLPSLEDCDSMKGSPPTTWIDASNSGLGSDRDTGTLGKGGRKERVSKATGLASLPVDEGQKLPPKGDSGSLLDG